MVKKSLTLVIVLSMVSVASAIVIDDFESYANTAALQAAWVDVSTNDQSEPGISSAIATLVTRDDGSKAMYVAFVLPGGWDYPDANAPWDEGYVKEAWEATSDRARIELTLSTPINVAADFNEAWQLKFDLEPVGPMSDLGDLNVYGVDVSGAFGRTIIPCPVDAHFQSWYSPEWCPAYLAEAGWVFPNQSDDPNAPLAYYRKYAGLDPLDDPPGGYLPYIYTGEWGQIICDDTRELNYGWGNVEMDTLTDLITIAIEVNSDTNLAEGFLRETEGGDKYPIKGGVYGFYIDNVELVAATQ
jgi:hypothetical protein